MWNVLLYFLISMLFIAAVAFYLWQADSRPGGKSASDDGIDDTLLPEPVTLRPKINHAICIGCGQCIDACPEGGVLVHKDKKTYVADYTRCLGHGACFQACPFDAITLVAGMDRRGEELPHLYENFESVTQGIFIAGELGGMGLMKNATEQAIKAVDNIVRSHNEIHRADYDLVIVGAGTAGLSAALNAKSHNLRFIVLEQDTIELSILNYPRRKISGTVILDLPLAGKITLKNTSKKELAGMWHDLVMRYRIPVQENCMVQSIFRENGCFNLISSDNQSFSSAFILLAIGRRGSPVKLNIPGENLEKVSYRLPDTDLIEGRQVLVAGSDNNAVESALLLSEKNHVTIVCMKDHFGRLTPLNSKSIEKAMNRGRIEVLFKTKLLNIQEKTVAISSEKGAAILNNDLVFIFAGGESTFEFLERTGVCAESIYAEEILYQ